MLYCTGYLSINSVDEDQLVMDFANQNVKSFFEVLTSRYEPEYNTALLNSIKSAWSASMGGDTTRFLSSLGDYLAFFHYRRNKASHLKDRTDIFCQLF